MDKIMKLLLRIPQKDSDAIYKSLELLYKGEYDKI